MSRAFTKEDDGDRGPDDRPLPSGPNYVTPRGLQLLKEKTLALETALAGKPAEEQRELRYFRARLASAVLVDNAKKPPADVRFGAQVTVRDEKGREETLEIVGQDEAEEGQGRLSWDDSLAFALNGRAAGDTVSFDDGRGERALTIVSLRYR